MTITAVLVLASGIFQMTLACVPTTRQHIRDLYYGWWVLFAAISASHSVLGLSESPIPSLVRKWIFTPKVVHEDVLVDQRGHGRWGLRLVGSWVG